MATYKRIYFQKYSIKPKSFYFGRKNYLLKKTKVPILISNLYIQMLPSNKFFKKYFFIMSSINKVRTVNMIIITDCSI